MAVFTEVSESQAQDLLYRLNLGELSALRGIEGGIENTNYFVTTDQGEYVLTLFERLTHEQLPFYLYLMKHLAGAGIPVPDPAADRSGDVLHTLCGKPAAVVNKLAGKSELAPEAVHCAAVGDMLARMHLAGQGYDRQQPNLRGLPWWNETVPVVLPYLDEAQSALIRSELAYQNHVASGSLFAALPRGPVHADLFRDNVMFEGERLTPEGAHAHQGPLQAAAWGDVLQAHGVHSVQGVCTRPRSTRSKCVGSCGVSMAASRGKWKSQSRETQKRSAPARSMAGSNCRSAPDSGRTDW